MPLNIIIGWKLSLNTIDIIWNIGQCLESLDTKPMTYVHIYWLQVISSCDDISAIFMLRLRFAQKPWRARPLKPPPPFLDKFNTRASRPSKRLIATWKCDGQLSKPRPMWLFVLALIQSQGTWFRGVMFINSAVETFLYLQALVTIDWSGYLRFLICQDIIIVSIPNGVGCRQF